MKKANPEANSTEQVDQFMHQLDHPLKTEVELVRGIIKSVNPEIVEQVKWNAPSFSYKGEYLVTFNLWEKKRIHLVFHNRMINRVKCTLLEGDYEDRRMAYFVDQDEIRAKTPALKKTLQDLIRLQRKPQVKV